MKRFAAMCPVAVALLWGLPAIAHQAASGPIRYEVRPHQVSKTKVVYQVVAVVPSADFPFGIIEIRAGVPGFPPKQRAEEIAKRMNAEEQQGNHDWWKTLQVRPVQTKQGTEIVVGPERTPDKWLITADKNNVKPWGVSSTQELGNAILKTIRTALNTSVANRAGFLDENMSATQWRMLGDTLQDSQDPGEYWKAVDAYQKALQKDPNLVQAKLGLSKFYIKRQQADVAADWYRQAKADLAKQTDKDPDQQAELDDIRAGLQQLASH